MTQPGNADRVFERARLGFGKRIVAVNAGPRVAYLTDDTAEIKITTVVRRPCAYMAALAWLGRAEQLGDLKRGYTVMPMRLA